MTKPGNSEHIYPSLALPFPILGIDKRHSPCPLPSCFLTRTPSPLSGRSAPPPPCLQSLCFGRFHPVHLHCSQDALLKRITEGLIFLFQNLEGSLRSHSHLAPQTGTFATCLPPAFPGLTPAPSIPPPPSRCPPCTPGFWSSSLKIQALIFFRLCSCCSLGWGPSRLSENATFSLAVFLDSSCGINCHLCSPCTCKHLKCDPFFF